jgi:nitroimidazol reductase NimA-like FMN-containing flavoprotein (pyridoxamine 5'-phosphate oxidase superfamily)
MEEIEILTNLCPVNRRFALFSASSSAPSSECTHSRAYSSVLAGGNYEFIPLKNVGDDKRTADPTKYREALWAPIGE